MKPQFTLCIYVSVVTVVIFSGCKGENTKPGRKIDTTYTTETVDTTGSDIKVDTIPNADVVKKQITFYGDTVWINPYGSQEWCSTITNKAYSAVISVKVDTNDFIIDTVISRKGNRIVIGYNHFYRLEFSRENKSWFKVSFDKKSDLIKVLKGTDYWLESNLDVFRNLVYNEKYNMFIIEFDINPRYNYGSVYYIVFNTEGIIQYIGTSSSWGGGGPDGESFLTDNGEMFITCYELYNFTKLTSQSITDYTICSDVLREIEPSDVSYKQVHAIRDLSNNTFLVVYDQKEGNPRYNALIMNTDSIILDRFQYEGLIEDVDALFLFYSDPDNFRYYIHDTKREILIYIENSDSLTVKQISESDMKKLPDDTLLSESYLPIDFESYGSKIFYISSVDSVMFYREGTIE